MPPTYARLDPQPLARGGELALVALTGAVTLVGTAGLVGLGIASWLFGGGWVWPAGTDTAVPVVLGLLAGQPGRGLPSEQMVLLPGPVAVYAVVGFVEAAMLAIVVAAVLVGSRYWRPNDPRRGLATRGQAADVLGVRRLKANRAVIRPDLHPSAARREASRWQTARARAGRRPVRVNGRVEETSW